MFEMALNRETLCQAGVDVTQAVAIGGGARSDRWLGIAADILGIPVRRSSQPEAACWGAARLAGQGAGLLPAHAASVRNDARIFLPDPDRSGYYRDRLAVYPSSDEHGEPHCPASAGRAKASAGGAARAWHCRHVTRSGWLVRNSSTAAGPA